MNNKRVLLFSIYAAVGVILLLILVVLFLLSKNHSTNTNPVSIHPSPTPFANIQSNAQGLAIVSSNPQNNQSGVPTTTSISIVFNQPISNIPFSISPSFTYTTSIDNTTLLIIPSQALQAGTTYSIILNLGTKNNAYNLYNYVFTTIGSTPTPIPTQQQPSQFDPTLQQGIQDFQLQNHPDVFLSNKTPYNASSFSITSNFVAGSPSGHWHFIVQSIGDPTQSKQDFISWAESLGLTADQINSLDITYQ